MAHRESDSRIKSPPLDAATRKDIVKRHSCNWEAYTDGEFWILRRGVDYMHTSQRGAVISAKLWARNRGYTAIAEELPDHQLRVVFWLDAEKLRQEDTCNDYYR